MNYNGPGSGYRDAWKSDGTLVARDPVTGLITLGVATYYIELGGANSATTAQAALASAHCAWNAALTATITVDTSNAPRYVHGADAGADHCTPYEAVTTGGRWVPENPSTAIVGISGASNTSTAATVVAGGAAIGGCMYHLGNMAARRVRLKIVVTVAGSLSCNVVGKAGA